jgi:16S rRNA G966 N2-methylase RsmD
MYPAPRFGHIVEPFAGSAAYSHLWGAANEVTLIEKNQRVAAIWEWLISVSEDELMSLPGIDTFEHIDETGMPEGPAREFVRQWCADACTAGQSKVTSIMKCNAAAGKWCFGSKHIRTFAANLRHIRHWRVVCEGYESNLNCGKSTWFVDPPYMFGGEYYSGKSCKASALDFQDLAKWCSSRWGDVIVCEGDGADWLPFSSLKDSPVKRNNSGFGTTARSEMVWYRRDGATVEPWNIGSFCAPGQETLF